MGRRAGTTPPHGIQYDTWRQYAVTPGTDLLARPMQRSHIAPGLPTGQPYSASRVPRKEIDRKKMAIRRAVLREG